MRTESFLSPRDVERIERPKIDNLKIIDAAERLGDFCLRQPDEEGEGYATRHVNEDLSVAVELKDALGPDGIDEPWISRIRVSDAGSPFESASGLEIGLPYGIHTEGKETPAWPYQTKQYEGVSASYPFDGMGWNSHPLFVSDLKPGSWPLDITNPPTRTVDLLKDTVGQVDSVIALGRPESRREWVGFYLSEVLSLVETTALQTK